MMRSSRIDGLAIAATLVLAGCGEDGTRLDPSGRTSETPRAEYTREMIFVAGDATAGAVLEFATTEYAAEVRRSARAWAEDGSGWTPLFDLSWQGPPLRNAWRLVPHGPLRIRVGLDDDVEALLVRDGEETLAALETGDFVTEWSPATSAQMVIREATLTLDGNAVAGWLVDARFGFPSNGGAADDDYGVESLSTGEPAAEIAAGQDTADTMTADGDSASAAPAPVPTPTTSSPGPVRSVHGLLVADDGRVLLIARTEAGVRGWLWTDGVERDLPGLTLTAVPGDAEAWLVQAGAGAALSGRIESLDEQPMPVAPRMVGATLDFGGGEVRMHGVLRPAAIE